MRLIQALKASRLARLLEEKVLLPLWDLLKQGVSPSKLALCIAIGAVLGIFPIIGTTTVLCAAVALALRLNLPAIQVVNYVVYPLQILLIIPFFQAGAYMFQTEAVAVSVSEPIEMFSVDFWGSIQILGWTIGRATLVWLLISPVVVAIVYFASLFALNKVAPSSSPIKS
jgi:uncharacterized protein (DUF2062 family)